MSVTSALPAALPFPLGPLPDPEAPPTLLALTLTGTGTLAVQGALNATLLTLTAAGRQSPVGRPTAAYLLAGFDTANRLLVMGSLDGQSFRWCHPGGIASPVGQSVLDPSLLYHAGAYWLVHDVYLGPAFTLLRSTDLTHWDYVGSIAGPATTYLWAPQWFRDDDGSVRVYVSAGNTIEGDFQAYEVHPLDDDLHTWSAPVQLSGTAACLIDPCMVKRGGLYHLWYKNEAVGHKVIEYATGTSPTGPFTPTQTGDWAGWGSKREGPMLCRLPSGGWRLYVDYYDPAHGLHYSDSADDWQTWTPLQSISAPVTVIHGDVVPFTDPAVKLDMVLAAAFG